MNARWTLDVYVISLQRLITLVMNFKNYINHLAYNPKDRKYTLAREWREQIRQLLKTKIDIHTTLYLCGLNQKQVANLSEDSLYEIIDIMTTTPPLAFSDDDINHLFFKDSFTPTPKSLVWGFTPQDSINNPHIQELIKEGLRIMQTSRDPVHDLSHIIRTIRFGKLLYNNLKPKNPNLDWGIIATAIIWHDLYRVNEVGFLYNKSTTIRRILRKFPILQDFFIYSINTKDAIGSCFLFLKKSKKLLEKNLRHKIAIAMLGAHSLHFFEEWLYPDIPLYKNIIFAADKLDQVTLARGEALYYNTRIFSHTDMYILNRTMVLLALFEIPYIRKHLAFDFARQIYEVIANSTYHYTKQFYPSDAALLARGFGFEEKP